MHKLKALALFFIVASPAVFAEPATDESIEQLSEIMIVGAYVTTLILGFIAGQQR